MAKSLAHEISNPLSVIRMNAELLRAYTQDMKIVEKLQKIINTTDKLTSIVRTLKSLSTNVKNNHFEWSQLDIILQDALEFCSIKLRNASIPLFLDYKYEISGRKFFLDSTHIMQVIVNLINNAADAIEKDQEKWIKLQVEKIDNHLILRVIDSGEGIDEVTLSKIESSMYTSKPAGKGLGLGLKLTRSYLASHGGELKYEFHEGHTAFAAYLPLDRIMPNT